MGRRSKCGEARKEVWSLRVSKELKAYIDGLDDLAGEMVIEFFEGRRLSGDMDLIDASLKKKRAEMRELVEKHNRQQAALQAEIDELLDKKARLSNDQFNYLDVRAKLVEKFAANPGGFRGWLTGPANEHLVKEARFSSPKEAFEFCVIEMDRRVSR
jgi:hypothetical protein